MSTEDIHVTNSCQECHHQTTGCMPKNCPYLKVVMKPGRKLYLELMDYFHGVLEDYEHDMERIKEIIEKCLGKGATDP